MILIPIIALGVGVLLGFLFFTTAPPAITSYIGICVIAGLDSVFGGSRSAIEGKFKPDVFATGFISNILIALFMTLLGDKIGVPLFFVAAIVLGTRIFTNLSLIRRIALTRWADGRQRKKIESEITAQPQSTP